jgi:hypothetical protein
MAVLFRIVRMAALLLAAAGTISAADESQVTVEGHRETLQRRARDFVTRITPGSPDTSLERWRRPICPSVAGLTAEQGEAVLTRVSQIARKAGAPLAPEHCEANLVIVVTPDPPKFIESWRARSRGDIFGDAAPMTVRHFIESSRPVRVWYNDLIGDQNGTDVPALRTPGVAGVTGEPFEPVHTNDHAEDTLIHLNGVKNLIFVMVIVDAHNLRHRSVGQMADYVSMVGLTRLDTGVHDPDAPTILNLFAKADGQKMPEGLTEWDEAFLHALYHTSQSSRMQRSAIAQSVVDEVSGLGK